MRERKTVSTVRNRTRGMLVFGFVVLVAGCTSHERTRHDVERAVREWPRARLPIASDRPAELRSIESDASTNSASAPAVITSRPVDTYVRDALKRNPGIRAAIADARAKLERIPQVTALPDPMIRAIARPEPIQTAAGDVYFTLGVSQTFPWLAKLERAGNIAAAETRMALEQLNGKRVQLVADVERAYWQVYRLDRYVEITRENRHLLADLARVVDTQYQVGKVQQQDLLRVQTELAKLRDDEHRYKIRRASVAAALNRLRDRPSRQDVPTTVPSDWRSIDADVEQLVALAADHSPVLAALREQIERDREQVELAKLGYIPDVTVGFEWNYLDGREPFIPPINASTGSRPPINRKSEVGDDNWAIMLQINLPIWTQRIESAKREAHQRLVATRSTLHDTENLIAFRIFDAWSRVEAQQHTLRVLEGELIPQTEQTYEVSLTAYQSGTTDFLTLIENWRRRLDFDLMQHREIVDLETAFADLQREVGRQLLRDASRTASPNGERDHE